ncbi:MAG: class I SAM-dependent methyltransferase, partial [Planctomycetota bacterium]
PASAPSRPEATADKPPVAPETPTHMSMKAYTSQKRPLAQLLRETLSMVGSGSAKRTSDGARESLERLRQADADMIRHGAPDPLEGLRMLDVGPGQLPRQQWYYAINNDVLGIDLDVCPFGFDPGAYLRMLRLNGPLRTVKTVVRKAMGVDRAFAKAMRADMGVDRFRTPVIEHRDATDTGLPDASFDLVYSFDSFEHFDDPHLAVREAVRLLMPGGFLYISLHHLSAEDGYHDVRIISGQRDDVPYWAHLRPSTRETVSPSSHLNMLSTEEWRGVFARETPGAAIELPESPTPGLREQLERIRSEHNELTGYTDEELLGHRFNALWKKPGA